MIKDTFIIVVAETMRKSYPHKVYKSRGHALRACNKQNQKCGGGIYEVFTMDAYNKITENMGEWRHNLMSGVPVWIPHNTPRSCDVSSELYWSM